MVLHRCDNTKCCNPQHLFLGTHLDNMADMRAKGRGNKTPPPKTVGEAAPASKLTEEAVREIRRQRANGVTTVELSRRYSVHTSVISRAATGKTWSHI